MTSYTRGLQDHHDLTATAYLRHPHLYLYSHFVLQIRGVRAPPWVRLLEFEGPIGWYLGAFLQRVH